MRTPADIRSLLPVNRANAGSIAILMTPFGLIKLPALGPMDIR